MTQFIELNFTEYNMNKENITTTFNKHNSCICCLSHNLRSFRLSTCEHTAFFENILDSKMEILDQIVCYQCHSMLKKITLFKEQVENSLQLLNAQTQNPTGKYCNLQRSSTEISFTINSQPLEFETHSEPLDYATTTEIKIEHDSCSDMDTDVPLSVLKKEKKVKKKNKVLKSQPHEKYKGKIRVVTLSELELMAERDGERKRDTYKQLPYKCESCIVGFAHEQTLVDHVEKRHTERKGSFTCAVCKSVLNTELSYKEHCKRHLRRYECEACGKRNNTLHALIKHYNELHGAIDTVFTCHQCGESTTSHRSYRYHRDKHKEKQQCKLCGSTFVNKTGLRVHMFTVHKQSNRVFSCTECDKVYKGRSGLLAHVAAAHATQRAYCARCRQHFRSRSNLRHHLRTHSRHVTDHDKRFACDECDSKFLTRPALQEHVDWVHRKHTKHECDKCSKVFKNGSALNKHKSYVHDKKRPPRNKICDHCGRGFTTLAILVSHIRTHTGERPLRCAHCAATFAHHAALYTHTKLLHSARPRVQ